MAIALFYYSSLHSFCTVRCLYWYKLSNYETNRLVEGSRNSYDSTLHVSLLMNARKKNRTVSTINQAQHLIRDGKDFRYRLSLTDDVKTSIERFVADPAIGIVPETGEAIGLCNIIDTVGNVVMYAILCDYCVWLHRVEDTWFLEFEKNADADRD